MSILGLFGGTLLYITGALLNAFGTTYSELTSSVFSSVSVGSSVIPNISLALRNNSSGVNFDKMLSLPSILLSDFSGGWITIGDVPGGEIVETGVVFGFNLGKFKGIVAEDIGGGMQVFGKMIGLLVFVSGRDGAMFGGGNVRLGMFSVDFWGRFNGIVGVVGFSVRVEGWVRELSFGSIKGMVSSSEDDLYPGVDGVYSSAFNAS